MIKNREKIAEQKDTDVIKEDKTRLGIVVGPSYDFLFEEGENEKYDDKYADFI